MDDGMDSQGGGSMAVGIGSQEDTMDYTMEQEEDMMDFTMSHDATNQTLSQLPDADEFSKENEEDEPPVLDFARSIGIARDHQLDDTSVDILLLMKDEVHHNFSTDLKHDHLPQLSTKAEINLDERLSICKGAARLLTSVAQNESQESLDIFIYPLLNPRNVRDMRFEPSLLRSDHEFDVKIFARRNGFDIRPQDIKLPLELVSVENNEGLEFPTDFYNFETETFEAIANEKIEVTRSSMIYLQTALKDTLTKGDEQEIWESERAHPTVSFIPSDSLSPLHTDEFRNFPFRIILHHRSLRCRHQRLIALSPSFLRPANSHYFQIPTLLLRWILRRLRMRYLRMIYQHPYAINLPPELQVRLPMTNA